MRYLITLLIAALSLNAVGQGILQLPYNPDENGDGLIGVPDLQALLAQYSLEFNAAVLSEDEESAIVYMGEMAHPVCTQACDNLPGFWHMSTMADLGLVWDEVYSPTYPGPTRNTWVRPSQIRLADGTDVFDYFNSDPSEPYHRYQTTSTPIGAFRCYCAAHEVPKVEYKKISGSYEEYVTSVASEGWKLLDGAIGGSNGIFGVMWRWADE